MTCYVRSSPLRTLGPPDFQFEAAFAVATASCSNDRDRLWRGLEEHLAAADATPDGSGCGVATRVPPCDTHPRHCGARRLLLGGDGGRS